LRCQFFFPPSDFPSASQSTYRCGARTRAPRVSKTGTDDSNSASSRKDETILYIPEFAKEMIPRKWLLKHSLIERNPPSPGGVSSTLRGSFSSSVIDKPDLTCAGCVGSVGRVHLIPPGSRSRDTSSATVRTVVSSATVPIKKWECPFLLSRLENVFCH